MHEICRDRIDCKILSFYKQQKGKKNAKGKDQINAIDSQIDSIDYKYFYSLSEGLISLAMFLYTI